MEGMTMRQCMDADNLHRRLKKIIGQVQAIDRMIDEDIPCEDILAQIGQIPGQEDCVQPSLPSTGAARWSWRVISSTASGTAFSTGMRTRPSRVSPRQWNASPT